MKVARDTDSKKRRGLDRFFIIASAEYRAGLVNAKKIRKDDAGQYFATQTAAKAYAKKLQGIIDAGANPSNTIGRTFGDALDRHYADLDRRQANVDGSPAHYDDIRARLAKNLGFRTDEDGNRQVSPDAFTLRGVTICDVPLSTIDVDLIESDLTSQICNPKISVSRQRKAIKDLRATFQCAIDVAWIVSNPARKIRSSRHKNGSSQDPHDREIYQRVLSNWSNYIEWIKRFSAEAVLPIQIAAQTGVRAGELTAITPKQIGHNSGQLTVDRAWKKKERRKSKELGLTKSGRARAIGLSKILQAQLAEHQLANGITTDQTLFGVTDHTPWRLAWYQSQFAVAGYFLTYNGNVQKTYRVIRLSGNETDGDIARLRSWADGQVGKPLHSKREDGVVFNRLYEAVAYAGITLLKWHDLRHLYCSVLFKNAEPITRITELLGHATEEVTRQNYKEWLTDPIRDVGEADRVAAAFG